MEFPVWVIGIGPGHPDYLLPAAVKAIEKADFLAGGPRALQLFDYLKQEKKLIDGNLTEVLAYIKARRKLGSVAVLVSGDPGFYSLLAYLKKHFPAEELQVIPGISSVQMAFAALKLPWQEAALYSLHGRPLELIGVYLTDYPVVALLTDSTTTPAQLAEFLEAQNQPELTVYLCDNMSYVDEKISQVTITELRDIPVFNNCVVVLKRGV